MTLEEKIAATQERIKAAKRAASFPKCVDCVFYHKTMKGRELCRQPLVASLGTDIHGKPTYTDISMLNARADKDLCGIEGDLFVEKTLLEKIGQRKDSIFAGIILTIVAAIVVALLGGIVWLFATFGLIPVFVGFFIIVFSGLVLRMLVDIIFDW